VPVGRLTSMKLTRAIAIDLARIYYQLDNGVVEQEYMTARHGVYSASLDAKAAPTRPRPS
jgi:hypothetical protein